MALAIQLVLLVLVLLLTTYVIVSLRQIHMLVNSNLEAVNDKLLVALREVKRLRGLPDNDNDEEV